MDFASVLSTDLPVRAHAHTIFTLLAGRVLWCRPVVLAAKHTCAIHSTYNNLRVRHVALVDAHRQYSPDVPASCLGLNVYSMKLAVD